MKILKQSLQKGRRCRKPFYTVRIFTPFTSFLHQWPTLIFIIRWPDFLQQFPTPFRFLHRPIFAIRFFTPLHSVFTPSDFLHRMHFPKCKLCRHGRFLHRSLFYTVCFIFTPLCIDFYIRVRNLQCPVVVASVLMLHGRTPVRSTPHS